MLRTFNMGLGMLVCVPAARAGEARQLLEAEGEQVFDVGQVAVVRPDRRAGRAASMNVAVLASGSGTNLQSLIDSAARGELGPARLAVVGVNVPGCRALDRAQAAQMPDLRRRPPRVRRAGRVRPRAAGRAAIDTRST